MASFEITGGRRLKGEIVPQGAKNEALQVLCAVLLTGEKVRIEHVPEAVGRQRARRPLGAVRERPRL